MLESNHENGEATEIRLKIEQGESLLRRTRVAILAGIAFIVLGILLLVYFWSVRNFIAPTTYYCYGLALTIGIAGLGTLIAGIRGHREIKRSLERLRSHSPDPK